MMNYNIPPKPGEVTLDQQKTIDLLYLRGHTKNHEALVAGAGYAIGALLLRECETIDDANQITGELTEQAEAAFKSHNEIYAPTWVDAKRLASLLEYGIEQGLNPAVSPVE